MEKELDKLNLDLQSKVELWLTYRKAKPAALISIRLDSDEDKPENHQKDIMELTKWLDKSGLHYLQDSTRKKFFYVSYDQEKVNKLPKIMWKDDPESTYLKGTYFGYPEEAVKIYAENIENCINAKKTFAEVGLLVWGEPEYINFDKYWKWYMRYVPRKDHLMEDSMPAKTWADIARADIPQIAQEFESELEKAK